MHIDEVISRGRRKAESLMCDTFTAYALTWSKDAGIEKRVFASHGTVRGRIVGRARDGDTTIRTIDIGGVPREILDGGLHVPINSPLPSDGWEYECTAVGRGSDPSLLGRRWRVVAVPAKTYATARRLDVVQIAP